MEKIYTSGNKLHERSTFIYNEFIELRSSNIRIHELGLLNLQVEISHHNDILR